MNILEAYILQKKRLTIVISSLDMILLKDLAKEFIMDGATIIGGCCETNPSHIKAFSELK